MCNISSFTVNNEFFLFLPIINYPMWVRDIHHIEGFLLASHLSFSCSDENRRVTGDQYFSILLL